jgi:hypothetical protein
MTFCSFPQYPNDLFLVVGTAQNMILAPKSCSAAYLRTYRFTNQDRGLELLHKVRTYARMIVNRAAPPSIDDWPTVCDLVKGLLEIHAKGRLPPRRECIQCDNHLDECHTLCR